MERSVSGLLHTTDTAKQENKVKELEFLENPKLSTLYQWNFDDFKLIYPDLNLLTNEIEEYIDFAELCQ